MKESESSHETDCNNLSAIVEDISYWIAYLMFKKDDPNQKVGIFLSDLQGRSPLQYYSFPICMELQSIT